MTFTDNMMIPAKAEHTYAAETMMNYLLRAGGRGQARDLRELPLAGEGRQGDRREDRSGHRRRTR